MFIVNVTTLIFRDGDFLVIAKEKTRQRGFPLRKDFSPRYGYSRKYERGIYTFLYKNISAFYPFDNGEVAFLAVELGGGEAYYIRCASKTMRNYYLNKLSKYIQEWGEK